jgi:hypothetical protein
MLIELRAKEVFLGGPIFFGGPRKASFAHQKSEWTIQTT